MIYRYLSRTHGQNNTQQHGPVEMLHGLEISKLDDGGHGKQGQRGQTRAKSQYQKYRAGEFERGAEKGRQRWRQKGNGMFIGE